MVCGDPQFYFNTIPYKCLYSSYTAEFVLFYQLMNNVILFYPFILFVLFYSYLKQVLYIKQVTVCYY